MKHQWNLIMKEYKVRMNTEYSNDCKYFNEATNTNVKIWINDMPVKKVDKFTDLLLIIIIIILLVLSNLADLLEFLTC
jgi:hypothetical protein